MGQPLRGAPRVRTTYANFSSSKPRSAPFASRCVRLRASRVAKWHQSPCGQGAGQVVGAGSERRAAGSDDRRADTEDALVARGRSRLDDRERVAGERPGVVSEAGRAPPAASSPMTYETSTRSAWAAAAPASATVHRASCSAFEPCPARALPARTISGSASTRVTDEIPGQAWTAAQAAMPGPAPRSRIEVGAQPGRAIPIWRNTSAAAAKVAGARVAR